MIFFLRPEVYSLPLDAFLSLRRESGRGTFLDSA